MRFRKLRIMWSVAFVVACALVTALWVHSYHSRDFGGLKLFHARYISFDSKGGLLKLSLGEFEDEWRPLWFKHRHANFPPWELLDAQDRVVSKWWFQIMRWSNKTEL